MKILGFSMADEQVKMVLKSDSSLLNNRKPFFLPQNDDRIRVTYCLVVRVCRLGKHIDPRFAPRYYDAMAHGLNFCNLTALSRRLEVEAWAFDYSLGVGAFLSKTNDYWTRFTNTILPVDEAVARVSQTMTIRQGDYIFVDLEGDSVIPQKGDIFHSENNNQELIYCKII